MADEAVLSRLQHVYDDASQVEWNEWQATNPKDVLLDLRDAMLNKSQLSHLNLEYIDFTDASFIECEAVSAKLNHSMFARTNFSGSNLSNALLEGADLSDANLAGVNLAGVSFRGSYLVGTNLMGANIAGANFEEAWLLNTIFAGVDLGKVVNLQSCRHLGPCVVDLKTLQMSGNIPLKFLRGVGLPDTLIDYLPSLLNEAIQHYSCFISYSSKDQEFADRLYADLQDKGVRCWFAPHDLAIGAKTWDAIDEAIRLRDKLLLVLSKNSIRSDWVEDEVSKAYAEERSRKEPVLLPIRIDDVVMATNEAWAAKLRDQRNIGNFLNWKQHDSYRENLERLLRDLKKRG